MLATTSLQWNCLIGGEWLPAESGRRFNVVNPASGDLIAEVADCGRNETRRAIEAAQTSFETFRETTAAERAAMLRRLHQALMDNCDRLAALITEENGKPLAEARVEIKTSAAYVEWYAEEARRVYGQIVPSPWKGRQILVKHMPVGVVAAITPWNFPSSMLSRKIGPAIAAGCTAVIKPAPQTPLSGLAWGALAQEAGVPAGVVNVVPGLDAQAIGEVLCDHPAVRKVTFTGSTRVGQLLMERGARTVKRFSMELGGNAPFIVLEDADIDRAVEGAMAAKYRNSGQTCISVNRFYVHSSVHDAFVRRLAEMSDLLTVGNGADPGVTQGPLIEESALAKVETLVADAVALGGRIETGGRRHPVGPHTYCPTVISACNDDMAIVREEVFGPVCAVFAFDDEDEVVRRANDTIHGLAAYIYSRDIDRATQLADRLEYGMVGINEGLIVSEVAPFGGVKQSGIGREGSSFGLQEYLDIRYQSVGGRANV